MEGVEEVIVGGEAGLEDEHAGVEVERRRRAELCGGPADLIGALLAVADLVLRGVAPCLLAETVHYCVEMAVWQIKQVVYVVVHLNVSVQVYHLTILHKLHKYTTNQIPKKKKT